MTTFTYTMTFPVSWRIISVNYILNALKHFKVRLPFFFNTCNTHNCSYTGGVKIREQIAPYFVKRLKVRRDNIDCLGSYTYIINETTEKFKISRPCREYTGQKFRLALDFTTPSLEIWQFHAEFWIQTAAHFTESRADVWSHATWCAVKSHDLQDSCPCIVNLDPRACPPNFSTWRQRRSRFLWPCYDHGRKVRWIEHSLNPVLISKEVHSWLVIWAKSGLVKKCVECLSLHIQSNNFLDILNRTIKHLKNFPPTNSKLRILLNISRANLS